jgi:pre-mRNA-splicing factor CWC22
LTDKSSPEYQRLAWEALKKTINGRVNKVNTANLPLIIRELFKDNIVRGRGLLSRGIIQAQTASPFYTSVYAALVSVINTKFPQIGELIVKRLISSFRRTYQRNDKSNCLATTKFIAHLVNQNILHEIVALQILVLLLENPSDDSVELAIGFLKECGQKLSQVSPRGLDSVFSTLRNLLHESSLDKRTQYMIEVLFAVRKDQFKAHLAVQSGLDLVDENDQYTHMLTLDDPCEPEPMLDVFKYDEQYEENEEKYKEIRRTILDESSGDDDESSSAESDNDEEGDGKKDDVDEDEQIDPVEKEKQQTIIDQTETNLVTLRRTIYLTIQSSIGAEECAHKLLKMNLRPGQEMELCQMILDSCAQQRTYERFFGLLGQRFCLLKKEYVECFEKVFQDQYEIVHRLENVKLRNVAKFFAHLLVTDAISWGVLRCIRLTEEDTTSSSRVYIKNLFLELAEFLGLAKLNNRLTDPTLVEYFEGLFPRDNPKNTRFSINFFTSIGLGGLTDELREFLKTMPRPASPVPALSIKNEEEEEDNKERERVQARLLELQMEKAKPKQNKDKNKKNKKRSPSSSSSSSTSSSSSSSSSSASPSPPPPPPAPSSRTRRDERDRRNENGKNDRRQQDQRSPNADHQNGNKKDDRRPRDQRSPNADRRKENKKEEHRQRDRRSRSPDRRNENKKEDRRQHEKHSPSPDRRHHKKSSKH